MVKLGLNFGKSGGKSGRMNRQVDKLLSTGAAGLILEHTHGEDLLYGVCCTHREIQVMKCRGRTFGKGKRGRNKSENRLFG